MVPAMPTLVCAGVPRLTVPEAGVVTSQAPEGLVVTLAVQFSVLVHAPAAVIGMVCVVGKGCPATPWKLSKGAGVEMAQGDCTTNVTGIVCGLPAAVWPASSFAVSVIAPLYVPGVNEDNDVTETPIGIELWAERMPEVAEIPSHAPPTLVAALALHVILPPPVFAMVMPGAVGLDCPRTALT